MKMDDLQALLASYGKPMDDLAAHPSAVIYDGAPMDPAVGAKCTVKYLMPLDEAEGALMKNRGLASVMPAVSPGFPAGLFIHVYDVRFGIYNRLHLLTDSAKPQPQVVAMLLQAQGVNYYPASPPFEKLERNWHTLDYVNTVNRGQGGIVIDTRVLDLRRQNYSIVVNTTGGFWPPITEAVLRKPAVAPKETDTWYVPQPLINLMLYSLSKSTHH